MSSDESIEKYLSQISSLSKQYFPNSIFRINYLRLKRFSARVEIEKNLFIDIFYNSKSKRKDFTLVENGERVLGWDNLDGWHFHPLENPSKHHKCKEPKIKNIFLKIKEVIKNR